MRQSREAKAETHDAIVAEASRLFRERGIDGTSVADVMGAARKTHGGFYRHFDSKEALLVAALDAAFDSMLTIMDEGFDATESGDRLGSFLAAYLSPALVEDVGGGCPVAALAGDVRRSAPGVRQLFGQGTQRIISRLAAALDGSKAERKRRATQAFAMAVGAVMIARASDPETATEVLAAVGAPGERRPIG